MQWLWGLEIFLWYACEQKCNFCFQKDLRYKEPKFLDKSYVDWLILKWSQEWKKSIIFSWWEATLDKNLLWYVVYAKSLWFNDIRIHTNWLTFSNKAFLDSFVREGVTAVIISIHWYKNIHDILVKKEWAFQKVQQTLLNLREIKKHNPSFVIDTNTVITKLNYKTLASLFKFLSFFPITRSQIVQLYSLNLFSEREKKSLYVSYEDFSQYIENIVAHNSKITFENFPLCKVNSKYWNYILQRQKYDNEAYWNMWIWFEESDCTYLEGCDSCSNKNKCTGIPKDYLLIFPSEIFKS